MDEKRTLKVLVVNDGSNTDISLEAEKELKSFSAIDEIKILDLTRNLGHQRAICIGLAYLSALSGAEGDFAGVVVMDSDGEDNFNDAFVFVRQFEEGNPEEIILARRKKRKESFVFRVFYGIYKMFFRLLTGCIVQGGNFSLVPRKILKKTVSLGEIWNNYHAGILKSRLKYRYIDCDRAKRYKGSSKMNFIALIMHGLSAVSVFKDVLFIRMLLFFLVFFAAGVLSLLVILSTKFIFNKDTPLGWATIIAGIIIVLCTQFLFTIMNFIFYSLSLREANTFLPSRDYKDYVLDVRML